MNMFEDLGSLLVLPAAMEDTGELDRSAGMPWLEF
jgi:hypothetical protein